MNKQELRSLIKEEIKKIVKESDFRLAGSDNEGMDDAIYIELKTTLSPDMQKKLAQKAQDEFGIDIKFIKNKAKKHAVFIPFAGDYANVMDLLKAMKIPNAG